MQKNLSVEEGGSYRENLGNYFHWQEIYDAVLQTTGQVSAEQAKEHAETEFEKYRIIQDRLFQSDFDRFMDALPFEENPKE